MEYEGMYNGSNCLRVCDQSSNSVLSLFFLKLSSRKLFTILVNWLLTSFIFVARFVAC